MRVANIIEEGKLGGPQVRMVRVAAALKGQVETVVVMPEENSDEFRRRCQAADVPFLALPLTRITRERRVALRYVLDFPFEVRALLRTLKRYQFDLVHISGGSWQYKGIIASAIAGIPAVWHVNDTQLPRAFRMLFNLFARWASGFIFASYRSKSYYAAALAHGKPHCVVPAPIDPAEFDPDRAYDGADAEMIAGWGDRIVVGTVCNVNPIKGLDTLVRCAAELRRRRHDVTFVVVGPTFPNQQRYRESLDQLARELGVGNIVFVGARGDVRALLQRFDIYLCTSRAESSPLSVWEAMAMRCPIVSTDVGDVGRHVQDGESGFVVGVDDHAAMADRLAQLANNHPAQRARCGEVARRTAREAFLLAKVALATADFYRQILAARKSAEGPRQERSGDLRPIDKR